MEKVFPIMQNDTDGEYVVDELRASQLRNGTRPGWMLCADSWIEFFRMRIVIFYVSEELSAHRLLLYETPVYPSVVLYSPSILHEAKSKTVYCDIKRCRTLCVIQEP